MQPEQIIEFKLKPALAECVLHRQRLHRAWSEVLVFAAFQASTASAAPPLSEDQIRVTDQVVFRFGRLQDAIGTRLLPAMLQLMQEWQDEAPFIDKLNRAEKLGLIPSALQWQELREIRNQTAHEYPAQPELVVANLRNLIQQVPALEAAHDQLQFAAQQRI
jgi:hypothetical protein